MRQDSDESVNQVPAGLLEELGLLFLVTMFVNFAIVTELLMPTQEMLFLSLQELVTLLG